MNFSKAKKGLAYIRGYFRHRIEIVYMLIHYCFVSRVRIHRSATAIFRGLKVHLYKVRKWHNMSAYYYGEISGNRVCFIKETLDAKRIQREIDVIRYINQEIIEKNNENIHLRVSKVYYHYSGYGAGYLIEEYINELQLSDLIIARLDHTQEEMLINKLFAIVSTFQDVGVIHCDLSPKNIYYTKDNDILVTDFEYSQILRRDDVGSKKNECYYPIRLGGKYALGNGVFDDAYSLLQIEKEICPTFKTEYKHLWIETNRMIGRLQLVSKATK